MEVSRCEEGLPGSSKVTLIGARGVRGCAWRCPEPATAHALKAGNQYRMQWISALVELTCCFVGSEAHCVHPR